MPIPLDQFHFKNSSIFDGLSPKEKDILNSRMTTHEYKKGQIVFHEGAFPAGIHIVKKGKVKKYKTGTDGKEHIFYVCTSGEFMGYHALLAGEQYSDSTASLENSVISFILKEDFLEVLNSSSILSNYLLKNLSHEFSVLINNITIQAQQTVHERLALSLLILRDKYKDEVSSDGQIHITLSREDLANFVGTAKETLVRLLRELKDENLIKAEGRTIVILDPLKLAKIANYRRPY
ncbi:MAG: Crp/Fnr family transcriptional regulator [Cytophagaceae bacterium]